MSTGYFIVLEGLDGCGKTTMAKRLTDYLKANGIDVIHTREPGGTLLAEQIRTVFLNMSDVDYKISQTTQALLMTAARRDHMDKKIIPAVYDNGQTVVCERFIFSTMVYQSEAESLDTLIKLGSRDVLIDMVLYLKTDYATAKERLSKRQIDGMDILDEKVFKDKQVLLERALGHYEIDNPGSLVVIDAEDTEDAVYKQIVDSVSFMINMDLMA